MKILHITPAYNPAFKYGGPIESVHLLNKTLVKDGIAVDVFTTDAGIDKNNSIEINKWNWIDGVRVKYFKYYFYEHYTFSPSLFFALFKEVSKYDLVHITGIWNFPVLAGTLACVLKKKPFVISPRGVLYKDAINIKSKFIKQLYFNLVAKHYLKRADAIHYTTENEKNCIFNELNLRYFIVPNGIDLSVYKNLPDEFEFKKKYMVLQDRQYILYLGRIDKQKGLSLLIDAFKRLSDEFPDLYLVIVGPDNEGYKKELEILINKLYLGEKILFTGLLTGKDKLAAYRGAKVFILPSYFENFSMSVIEAMACYTPVIVSNKVGIAKDIKEAEAGVVIGTTSDEIYRMVKSILCNREYCTKITHNGRVLVETRYDINLVSKSVINEYKCLLNTRR